MNRVLSLTAAALCLAHASCSVAADPPVPAPDNKGSAASSAAERTVIATWNLEWFFDDHLGDNYQDLPKKLSAPNREEWQWRLSHVAHAIARLQPTILALQEVESDRTVWYLTQELKRKHQLKYRIAFIQGTDFYTEQDVAVLYRDGLVEYSRRLQTEAQWESRQFYNVNKHILCRFQWGEGEQREDLLLVNVHLRATPDAANIRIRQARLIRSWIADATRAGQNVIVLGDINTEVNFGQETARDEVGILRGLATADERDDLFDLNRYLEDTQRNTHLIGRQFDRIFVSRSLLEDDPAKRDLHFDRIGNRKDVAIIGKPDADHYNIYYTIPQAERDLSDHYPLVAEFLFE